MKIKCLSLRQPFADLIVTGKKTIELRRWNTKHRGPFLIHAAKKPMMEFYKEFGYNEFNNPVLGHIVGQVTLVDVKYYNNYTEWVQDKDKHLAGDTFVESNYGFILKDAVKFRTPIPLSGQLNFFDVDIDIVNNYSTYWYSD